MRGCQSGRGQAPDPLTPCPGDTFASGSEAHEDTSVGAAGPGPDHDAVPLGGKQLINRDLHIRKCRALHREDVSVNSRALSGAGRTDNLTVGSYQLVNSAVIAVNGLK